MYTKKISGRIKYVLQKYPETRDSDALLIAGFMFHSKDIPNPGSITGKQLLQLWHNGKIPSLSSVERARRKIQKEHPQFRGKLYDKRQSFQRKWKKSLGYPVSSNMLSSPHMSTLDAVR